MVQSSRRTRWRRRRAVSCADAAKAMSELLKLADDAGAGCQGDRFAGDDNHLFFQLGDRLLISASSPATSRTTSGCCRRITRMSVTLKRDEIRARHRTRGAVRRRAFARHPRAVRDRRSQGVLFALVKPARAKRACPASTTGPTSRSASMRSTCWISCAPIPQRAGRVRVQGPEERRRAAAGRRRHGGSVSLRGHADENLKCLAAVSTGIMANQEVNPGRRRRLRFQ